MIKNQETLIIQSILSITVIIGICWRKSLVLAVYYTITLLLVSETKHWSVSHKQMKNTLEASKAYNYLEMATYKSGFNILIKGIVTPEYYNTKREMIDCIKLAMLQTERTFKNLCLKDISKSKEDYLITYSDINYGSMLNMYCHKSELLELSNYKLNLLEKKTLGWKNINAFKNKNEVLSMKGFNKNESWGRWAKNKQTRIYLRKMLNGNSQIKFMARSLNKAAIRIGSMTIELDKEWKQVKYNIKNMNCMEVVEIEYIGKPTTIEGRTLTYAIKKLEIINQNTFN